MMTLASLYQAEDERKNKTVKRMEDVVLSLSQPEASLTNPLEQTSQATTVEANSSDGPVDLPMKYTIPGIPGIYTDLKDSSIATVQSLVVVPPSRRRGPRGGVTEPFPTKLFEMLQAVDADDAKWKEVVGWKEHGRCFEITQPNAFVEQLMPRFFKQTKLTSFQRQLHLYGFLKISSGPDAGCYYHPLFLRGRADIIKFMVRVRAKDHTGGLQYMDCETTRCVSSLFDLPFCTEKAVLSRTKYASLLSEPESPKVLSGDDEDSCDDTTTPASSNCDFMAVLSSLDAEESDDDLLMEGLLEFLDQPEEPAYPFMLNPLFLKTVDRDVGCGPKLHGPGFAPSSFPCNV